MIKIEKVLLHDKKRLKHWASIVGSYKGLKCLGVVETNLKTLESKINYLSISHGSTPEEDQIIKEKGFKPDQRIEAILTNEEVEVILKAVKESGILNRYIQPVK